MQTIGSGADPGHRDNRKGVFHKDLLFVEPEESVEFFFPLPHVHRLSLFCLHLGVIQIHGDNTVETLYLGFREIIFRNGDIPLPDFCPFPRGQAHVRLCGISPLRDDLRRGVAGDRPVQLVLHDPEKIKRGLCAGIVIGCKGIDLPDLLVEPFLRCPDVADAFQEFVEIIGPDIPAFL